MDEDQRKAIPEDQVIDAIGKWGPVQLRYFILASLFVIPCCFPILNLTFMNTSVDFWCARPDHLKDQFDDPEIWRKLSGQTGENGSACQIYDVDYTKFTTVSQLEAGIGFGVKPLSLGLRPCKHFEYDLTDFDDTFTTEWDLVCDREYLKSMSQTVFFLGQILGVYVTGVLSDKYGRKTIIIPKLVLMSLVGSLATSMPTVEAFMALRFVHAAVDMGVTESILSYNLEMVGGNYKTVVGIGIEVFWVAGFLILSLLAYCIRTWRMLNLVTSLPGLASLGLIWLIPESPKWLLSTGRLAKAERVVRSMAKGNGRDLKKTWSLRKVLSDNDQKERSNGNGSGSGLLDLFRTKHLCFMTLVLHLNFFANSFCYYGLTLNMSHLGGDVHLNFFISALTEIPGYTASYLCLRYLGRRLPYMTTMLLCGACLIAAMFVPADAPTWLVLSLAFLGKILITCSYSNIYIYAGELFPTVLRTTGLGSVFCLARFAGMASAWVAMLTTYNRILPMVVYGLTALVSGLLAFYLPETKDLPIPDSVEEVEARLKQASLSRRRGRSMQ